MKDFSDDFDRESSNAPGRSNAEEGTNASDGAPSHPKSSLSEALGQSYTPSDDEVHGGGYTRPLTEADYLEDPLLRLERNNKSTRNAFIFFFGTVGMTLGIALVIGLIGGILGGPRCTAGEASWLCTQGIEIAFWVVPGVLSFIAMFLSVYITYDKWRRHQRWRPWIAVIWFLMPYALGWMTSAGAALLLTS